MDVVITHIEEVLPYIKDHKEFIHVVKDDYQVIDYVFVSNEIFKSPKEEGISDEEKHKRLIQLQCRGIKFDLNGVIIARPFHKFKNYGEDSHINNLYDWSKPHTIMTKMDGSMVHTAIINSELRLCTRMGITEQSIAAEKLLTVTQNSQLGGIALADVTVIFEYTAPDNRIVIEYEKPALTILAVRRNLTGVYFDHESVVELGEILGIPVVDVHSDIRLGDDNIASIRENTTGIEGYVVAWEDGTRTKIKTDEYCQMHRAVSYFERESMILPVVLDMQCDDIYPNLSQDRKDRLFEYEAAVLKEFNLYVGSVQIALDTYQRHNLTRKEYALWVQEKVPKGMQGAFFAAIDGKSIPEAVKSCLIRNPELLSVRW